MESTIKTLRISPGDVLVVEVDVGNLPNATVTRYFESVKTNIKEHFPNNAIMVIPMHKTRLAVIKMDDAPGEQVSDVEYKEVN